MRAYETEAGDTPIRGEAVSPASPVADVDQTLTLGVRSAQPTHRNPRRR